MGIDVIFLELSILKAHDDILKLIVSFWLQKPACVVLSRESASAYS